MVRLSVVIPTLNEGERIAATLRALAPAQRRGAELIVVDGGSEDRTMALAAAMADRVLSAARGRAAQLNAGAAAASGSVLLFLHADSQPPPAFDHVLLAAVAQRELAWGRFDVRIASARRTLDLVAAMMNLRSRLTGIATGDQGIFATRALFERLGGFPLQPLMEDIAFSREAKRLAAPVCLRSRIVTSGRRWERHGVAKTILLMWRLRLAYFCGADPRDLALRYDNVR
jgi:rSAM/selenodomain-associated transferase 2